MTDTIQRRRNTEGHRVSCNVGIGEESDIEIYPLKGKTAPSPSALFFPFGLGLTVNIDFTSFFSLFGTTSFHCRQPFFLDLFDLYSYAKLENMGGLSVSYY